MRKTLPILASTALLLSPAVASTAHADTPVVHDVTTSADSNRVYAMVTVAGQWHIDNPTAGDAFTAELGNGLKWPTGTSFPLTERTTGAQVATCTAVADTSTLTCTFNATSEQWDSLDGNFQARAQIKTEALGTTSSTVLVAGAEVPVNFPGAIIGQAADRTTQKYGWYAGETTGGHLFRWDVNVSGSSEYTVTDPGAKVENVACTDGTWQEATRVTYKPVTDGVAFTAPSSESVCRVRVTTVTSDERASNTATVNGTTYSAAAVASANGEGSGDGANKPTPTPTEEPSSTPTPTPEETTPAPVPTPEETTPAPAPTPSKAPTAEPSAEPTNTPTPEVTTPAPAPTPKETPWTPAPSPKPSSSSSAGPSSSPSSSTSQSTPATGESAAGSAAKHAPSSTPSSTTGKHTATATTGTTAKSLAHTGADGWLAAFAVVLLACGAAVYVINRPKH
jgi:hypothetical protein